LDPPDVTPDQIATYFTKPNGEFLFRRWSSPIVPHAFGPTAPGAEVITRAFDTVSALSGHPVVHAPDGAGMNLTLFFVREASDMMKLPGAEGFLGMLAMLVKHLTAGKSALRRNFNTDAKSGAITQMTMIARTSSWLRHDPPDVLALRLAVLTHLTWAMTRGPQASPLVVAGAPFGLHPDVAAIFKVAYDPSLPDVSTDPAICTQIAELIAKNRV
jgi:hypothetical protein